MTTNNEAVLETDAKKRARKRVRELKEFYSHLATYLVVNLLLVTINLVTSPGTFWAIWPILGWGIGIMSHAVSVFGLFGIGNSEWEERKVQELMRRDDQLTEDQIRRLLRQELPSAGQADADRIIRRLEHLEAIVTSKDWDILDAREPGALPQPLDLPGQETEDPASEAARIARRVQ